MCFNTAAFWCNRVGTLCLLIFNCETQYYMNLRCCPQSATSWISLYLLFVTDDFKCYLISSVLCNIFLHHLLTLAATVCKSQNYLATPRRRLLHSVMLSRLDTSINIICTDVNGRCPALCTRRRDDVSVEGKRAGSKSKVLLPEGCLKSEKPLFHFSWLPCLWRVWVGSNKSKECDNLLTSLGRGTWPAV